jgi:magnesium-transporting ATPase (P-type)
VCHTVVIDKNTGAFNAASPDELALIEGAKKAGYIFLGKDTKGIMSVKTPDGRTLQYKYMNVCEFNSTRKRMSLVVRDLQTSEILLLSKGADSIMMPLLNSGQSRTMKITQGYIDNYAQDGLRTLLLGKRVISPAVY